MTVQWFHEKCHQMSHGRNSVQQKVEKAKFEKILGLISQGQIRLRLTFIFFRTLFQFSILNIVNSIIVPCPKKNCRETFVNAP